MSEIKDLIYIIGAIGGIFVSLVGIYWGFRYRFKEHAMKISDHDDRLKKLETISRRQNRSIEKKISIIEINLIRLMEKQGVEPVPCLFDDDEEVV